MSGLWRVGGDCLKSAGVDVVWKRRSKTDWHASIDYAMAINI
jgi:hypothetical protein